MEAKATHPHQQVANEADEENRVMAMSYATPDAFEGEEHKPEVGQGVHDFGGIFGRVVVLPQVSVPVTEGAPGRKLLHTN